MKLFLLINPGPCSCRHYESAVVCAKDEASARDIHPGGQLCEFSPTGYWLPKEKVKVEYLGEARDGMKTGVICSNYWRG